MKDLNDKVTGGTLSASEWNEVPSEIQNVIEALDIGLSSSDLNQLGKGIAGYVANGNFYTDSGIANAYVLSVVGLKQGSPQYTDGFSASFITANANTGASTVNVAGLGVKEIKLEGGGDPISGDISGRVELSFDLVLDRFTLLNQKTAQTSAQKFSILTDVLIISLAGVNIFVTLNGLNSTDDLGATFGFTGNTILGNAGLIIVDAGLVYDVNGLEFKIIGYKIRLESLGLIYTTTGSITLGHILALRNNGFLVNVSPRYSLTDFEGQKTVNSSSIENIIHRCMGLSFPENTLISASMAVNRTFGLNVALEFDVQITSDGIPIVFHDLTLDDDTDGTGIVTSNTLAQIRAAKFTSLIGTAFEEGVRIPTLDDFIKYAVFAGVKIYPEIKAYRTVADIQIMNNVIAKYRFENRTVWQSFNISDLQELRKYNQQSAVGWVIGQGTGYTTADLDTLFEVGRVTILSQFNDLITIPTDIDVFHSYGFDVAAYTIQRVEQMQEVTNLGVNKILSDINSIPEVQFVSVASEQGFNTGPWTEVLSGTGTAVYTGNPQQTQTTDEIVTLEGNNTSEATVNLAFNQSAGEWTQMTVLARNFGTHVDDAQIDIDSPYGTRKETINIISEDYIEYRISYQNVITESFDANQIAFVLGSISTRDSGAQFYRPQIQGSNTAFGFRRCLMYGLLTISPGGVYSLHTNHNQFNVNTITTVGNDIEIRPTKEANTTATGVLNGIFPIVEITPTNNGMTTTDIKFTAHVNDPQGKVRISAFVGIVQQNISALSTEFRINFSVYF